MKFLQFSKPKNPGFGISKDYYLSVLATKTVLPAILDILNPGGTDGAVAGFGAPLSGDVDKTALSRPMERGVWVLASADRKTVLRLRILSKEEAGFDPDAFVQSKLAIGVEQETLLRLKATWSLLQFNVESHDAMVYPALDFILTLVDRVALLCDGVVADPLSGRYLLPGELRHLPPVDARIDARDHISVKVREIGESLGVYTSGLRKFSLPEFEIRGALESELQSATVSLMTLAQSSLLGKIFKPGESVAGGLTVLAPVVLDRFWEGIPVLEVVR